MAVLSTNLDWLNKLDPEKRLQFMNAATQCAALMGDPMYYGYAYWLDTLVTVARAYEKPEVGSGSRQK